MFVVFKYASCVCKPVCIGLLPETFKTNRQLAVKANWHAWVLVLDLLEVLSPKT